MAEEMEIDLDAMLDAPTQIERTCSIEEIRHMIAQLSVTEEGEPLAGAMKDLKKAILENGGAAAQLLPQEVGEMVSYLYKVTGKDLQIQQEKATKRSSSKKNQPKFDFSDPNIQQQVIDDL